MATPGKFPPPSTASASYHRGTGISGGNSNVTGQQTEVLQLTVASQREKYQHEQKMIEIEARNRAYQIDVPTLPSDVKTALRSMGLPVRLFGENLANVRDRLRIELAKRELLKEQYGIVAVDGTTIKDEKGRRDGEDEEEEITKYSRASPELIRAREVFAIYSLDCARRRLEKERGYRIQWQRKRARLLLHHGDVRKDDDNSGEDYIEVTRIDDECVKTYKSLRNYGLEGSQYGDDRPISSIAATTTTAFFNGAVRGDHRTNVSSLVATGSWSGTIKLWDGSSPELTLLASKSMAHEDRIMGLALQRPQQHHQMVDGGDGSEEVGSSNKPNTVLMATASIDTTAKLWKIRQQEELEHDQNDNMDTDDGDRPTGAGSESLRRRSTDPFHFEEVAHLKGHARRLAKVAFHPKGQHVATTSFDHTWRLWDVETGIELLLQDGHWKEVYGVGFHPDGSMCSTTDYGGIVQCWDIRTGKSLHHFLGHARRVLCTEFSPNGYQLATAGDDGTIKIWDLRQRKQFASIPAHSNLITQIQFDRYHNGEYLVSSSFDGTAKVWSTRDYKMLASLRGHEGKVMGVDVLRDSIVTSGFDKTLKLWS